VIEDKEKNCRIEEQFLVIFQELDGRDGGELESNQATQTRTNILHRRQCDLPEHYIFRHRKHGLAGNDRKLCAYEIVPSQPMRRGKSRKVTR
jgi:hypothetical protein